MRAKKLLHLLLIIFIWEVLNNMQKEILTELEDLIDETEFIINNQEIKI